MRNDFRNHLLRQIEMLRAGISYVELSERLGEQSERCLARYIAGKSHLREDEFRQIAKALSMDAETLARAWGRSLGLRMPLKRAVGYMAHRAFLDWRKHTRLSGVPPHPSPMAIIRIKYRDRLSRQTPPLWFAVHGNREKDTPKGRVRFARAYEMLVESVHEKQSHRDIGALRGISGERARQLMQRAAYTWARSEGIHLLDDRQSIPFKNDAKLVKNLYAGLRFFAEQVGASAHEKQRQTLC